MKKIKGHKISAVEPGSIAWELELEPGDELLTINGNEIEDIFDYEYWIDSEAVTLLVRKADGEEWELDIENGGEDLGLTFENGLMSDYKTCCNKCIFCFIDQMPPGMRETLYFKDDDSGPHQHFRSDHQPRTAVQNASQPVCWGGVKKDRPSLRGRDPHERPGRPLQRGK